MMTMMSLKTKVIRMITTMIVSVVSLIKLGVLPAAIYQEGLVEERMISRDSSPPICPPKTTHLKRNLSRRLTSVQLQHLANHLLASPNNSSRATTRTTTLLMTCSVTANLKLAKLLTLLMTLIHEAMVHQAIMPHLMLLVLTTIT